MHLLIYNTKLNFALPPDIFQLLPVSDEINKEATGILKEVSEKDYFPNHLCEKIESIGTTFQSVVIITDEELDWNLSIRTACHLRFHSFSNGLDSIPIVLAFNLLPNLLSAKGTFGTGEIDNFQHEEGFFIKNTSELFSKTEDETGKQRLGYEVFYQEELIGKSFDACALKTIRINPNQEIGRHAIANQWGAVNLARNAGYNASDTGYQYPPTLYFKYLLKKYHANTLSIDERKRSIQQALGSISKTKVEDLLVAGKLNFSKHPYFKRKRILLIDDNAENGWKQTLSCILAPVPIDIELDYEKINQFGNLKNLSYYDLIFLDLRLPKIGKNEVKIEFGLDLLKKIKEDNPQVPVIVFTASNKSWTMYEVMELGADGMYVKESPEYAADKEYSHQNFQNFVQVVIGCLDKYHVLRLYWEQLLKIKENILPVFSDTHSKAYGSRIIERLEMFYGLIKRGYEQTKFDQDTFHFSYNSLAFMTLWSILNEISDSCYDNVDAANVFTLTDNNGEEYTCKPIPNYNWKLKSTGKYLIKHDFEFKEFGTDGKPTMTKTNLPFLKSKKCEVYIFKDTDKQSYSIPQQPINRHEVTNEISSQIAFLLRNRTFHPDRLDIYCHNLFKLNIIRNKLYLTHGDNFSKDFYSKTEKEKDKHTKLKPEGVIKDLFELVAFLLTEQDLELTF